MPVLAPNDAPAVKASHMAPPKVVTERKTYSSGLVWYPAEVQAAVAKDLTESCTRAKVKVHNISFGKDNSLTVEYESKGAAAPEGDEFAPANKTWRKENTARDAMEKVRRRYEKQGFCFVSQEVFPLWKDKMWSYSLVAIF